MTDYNYCNTINSYSSNNDTSINILYTLFSTLNLVIFYGILSYGCKKLITLHYDNYENNKANNYNNITFCFSDIIKTKSIKHNDDYKINLFKNLMSLGSINRAYILYFIFKKKGEFTTSFKDNRTDKIVTNTYNSYILYNRTKDSYNLSENDFNLNISDSPDTLVAIGDTHYYLTIGNIKYIQWLYYTGLYEYLINNNKLKYDILNEMNEEKLLVGNVFLRYQLYLCEEECGSIFDVNDDVNDDSDIDSNVDVDVDVDVDDTINNIHSDESHNNTTSENSILEDSTSEESLSNDTPSEDSITEDNTSEDSLFNDITLSDTIYSDNSASKPPQYYIESDDTLDKYTLFFNSINIENILK